MIKAPINVMCNEYSRISAVWDIFSCSVTEIHTKTQYTFGLLLFLFFVLVCCCCTYYYNLTKFFFVHYLLLKCCLLCIELNHSYVYLYQIKTLVVFYMFRCQTLNYLLQKNDYSNIIIPSQQVCAHTIGHISPCLRTK